MTNQEILYKAILKCGHSKENAEIISCYNFTKYKYMSIIFDHKFAKDFWGEFSGYGEPFGEGEAPDGFTNSGFPKCKRDWRFHIQKMALEQEPLKYLEQFLEVKTS